MQDVSTPQPKQIPVLRSDADSGARGKSGFLGTKLQNVHSEQKETFYSALYHTNLSPILYEDVDGQYRGLDQNIHTSDGFVNATERFLSWYDFEAKRLNGEEA